MVFCATGLGEQGKRGNRLGKGERGNGKESFQNRLLYIYLSVIVMFCRNGNLSFQRFNFFPNGGILQGHATHDIAVLFPPVSLGMHLIIVTLRSSCRELFLHGASRWPKKFLVSLTTTGVNARSPTRFGRAMRPLNTSARAQTSSSLATAPMPTKRM